MSNTNFLYKKPIKLTYIYLRLITVFEILKNVNFDSNVLFHPLSVCFLDLKIEKANLSQCYFLLKVLHILKHKIQDFDVERNRNYFY